MSAVNVSSRPTPSGLAREYFQLTKPTIVMLMLVTGLPAILMAGRGHVEPLVLVMALVGTAMAAGAASALNHYWDRDIDAVMERTSKRPIPGGHVGPSQALSFGLTIGVLSVALLAMYTTWLAAALGLFSIFFYVVIYTMWLKRSTPQNIVIGGAAGATAPLIGWAAVTGHVSLEAWLMFAVIFLWTPPHFWALALYRKEDYARAGVPMMPVVAGERATILQMVVYTWLTVACSLGLWLVGSSGWLYLLAAAGLGAVFIWRAHALLARPSELGSKKLFVFSIFYLLGLFVAIFLDEVLRLALLA
jgi:protoheme IX farnesyltransferase